MRLITFLQAFLVLSLVSAKGDIYTHRLEGLDSSFLCKTCGVFTSIFKHVLDNSMVQKFMDTYLEEHVCPMLPAAASSECEKDIPEFVAALTRLLEALIGPNVCCGMGVCEPENVMGLLMRRSVAEALVYDSSLCTMCQELAKKVEKGFDDFNPVVFDDYKRMLLTECTKLGPMKNQCIVFVEKYSSLLVYFVLKEASEHRMLHMCADLHICPSSPTYSAIPPLPPSMVHKMSRMWMGVNAGDHCDQCMAIAERAFGGIIDPAFKEEVNTYIGNVCSHAPPIKGRCTKFLTEMASKFLDFVAAELEPSKFCEELHLCGGGAVSYEMKAALGIQVSKPKALYVS